MKTEIKKTTIQAGISSKELIAMQTEVGLLQSMLRSKALTAIVVVALVLFAGFFVFLSSLAG